MLDSSSGQLYYEPINVKPAGGGGGGWVWARGKAGHGVGI